MNIEKVRTLQIAWDRNIPKEVKNALRPMVDRWSYLVPTWCHLLKFSYNTQEELVMATCAEPKYRRAFTTVGSGWLVHGPQGRVHSLVHELLHIPWEPVTETLDTILSEYVKDEAARNVIEAEWRNRYEAAVEDLANALVGPRDY